MSDNQRIFILEEIIIHDFVVKTQRAFEREYDIQKRLHTNTIYRIIEKLKLYIAQYKTKRRITLEEEMLQKLTVFERKLLQTRNFVGLHMQIFSDYLS